jgi:hypothetical protein
MSNPNEWNKKVIEEFRANDGKVGDYFIATYLNMSPCGFVKN